MLMLGLPDRFIDHGDHQKLLAAEGLDAGGIERSIRSRFGDWVEPLGTAASSGTPPNPSVA
jgi:1-deoxy-D-xylulose-5-phosphate synthase